jgi:hypothetical protein
MAADFSECVKVRIRAELVCDGCFVGIVHGWAVSDAGGHKLDRVFLVGDELNAELEEGIGPELDDGFTHDPLKLACAQALWAKARKFTTTDALIAARREERNALAGSRADHLHLVREDAA